MGKLYWKEGNSQTKQEVKNMYNEKSKKNLKMFSANNQPKKNGRPKGSLSLTNEIKKVLEGVDEASKKQIVELLAIGATKHAMKGNAAYFKEIIERVDGKITDKTELTLKNGEPIKIEVTYED
jgi:hypothetical protein